jgi:hypothetical protein
MHSKVKSIVQKSAGAYCVVTCVTLKRGWEREKKEKEKIYNACGGRASGGGRNLRACIVS